LPGLNGERDLLHRAHAMRSPAKETER
jgi:hypothetical protein